MTNNLAEDNNLTMDEIYEGRRKYPRVELDVVMMIKTTEGNQVRAKINNISIDGAQINCDKETARAILPKDSNAGGQKQQPSINGMFELHVDGKKHTLEMECKIYYVVSLDGKTVSLGLLFDEVDSNNKDIIEQFIMRTMEEYH